MNYDEFCESCLKSLSEVEGFKGAGLQLIKDLPNRKGFNVIFGARRFTPSVNLDSYYEAYSTGALSFEGAVKDVEGLLKFGVENEDSVHTNFQNKDWVLSHLSCRLANVMVFDGLEKVLHRPFLDLEIIPIVVADDRCMTACVTHKYLKYLDLSEDEIFDLALKAVADTGEIEVPGFEKYIADLELRQKEVAPPFWILSNQFAHYGAIAMLNKELLERVSQSMRSFWIIPSSVHEILCIPKLHEDKEELDDMVQTVNHRYVSDDEVLSHHVYFYDENEKCVRY